MDMPNATVDLRKAVEKLTEQQTLTNGLLRDLITALDANRQAVDDARTAMQERK